ncbi:electron transfer flavoprotein-ubiquinone oxidoreductase [Stemphylium lycopersici]|uniref:Probable electron transfer flavoprotein-ubiquinone oxidoreductase, mitochondrial n=1 Tax=Stemphylium lycopersici TaxID=183478 RepID=A0A364MZB1_STELY|nr:electron transfer flavoprotein-ubiquinone oxidoreductase [Stemphylium lycopersici]
MATRSIPASITRRLLTTPRSTPIATRSFACASSRTRNVSALYRPAVRVAGQRRCLSTTPRQRLAAVDDTFDPKTIERESDEVDVLIVGGGPAGLSAAIKLKQIATAAGNEDFRVLVLEKAGELGDHIVSGNVIEPSALDELLPDWRSEDNLNRFADITPAKEDHMFFMTKDRAIPLPKPPQMNNHGNFIISLNQMVKWLGERAEEAGVEVYPGFAASEILYNHEGVVTGVATNDLGISREGKAKDSFERGMEFHARVTLLGEGCHGSLSKQIIKKYDLRRDSQHQTYGLGIKEVWEVQPEKFKSGLVVHSMGYPLPKDTYGGAWMYHFGDNLVSIGLVVGLDYPNPWLAPYGEFQKMKHHPYYQDVLEGGKCISYGARTLVEGGFQSIPKLAFPGGALLGDAAGLLNLPKIKGTHNAMRSGMLAAEATWDALQANTDGGTVFLYDYEDKMRKSSIWSELKTVRNMRPSFHTPLGVYGGIMYSGLEAYLLRGKAPWTLKHGKPDHAATKTADECQKIEYPKPDGKISFDILTSVSRSGTNHEEDQPCHLQVKDYDAHAEKEWPRYKGVENRFCPAGVYEYVEDDSKELGVRFQINAQNCVHCKTCDIKVPDQDINWQTPQGGEGPKFFTATLPPAPKVISKSFTATTITMTEVSSTRLYLGNLPRNATKADVEGHFSTHGTGDITEIKLMNGFGFIEYKDAMDARDVVPDGSDFMGERLIVQFARGSRARNENFTPHERVPPRPRRTPYRMRIANLPVETSWQDLKDFARQSGLDVVYSEVGRERDGTGFVEYETAADLKTAVEKLDRREFKGQEVTCIQDVSDPPPPPPFKPRAPYGGPGGPDDRGRDRYRSRSPMGRRGYPPAPYDDYYDRRGPPRGYSPRRDDYRRRTPPREFYDRRDGGYGRSPPRGRMPDEYGPPRPRYPDDPYDARAGPPPRRYDDPYMNGHGRPYDGGRPPSPRGARPRSPGGRPPYDAAPADYPPRGRY